jgi:hypothetical protein
MQDVPVIGKLMGTDLLSKIRQAQKILADESIRALSRGRDAQDLALAVLDAHGDIHVVRARKNKDDLTVEKDPAFDCELKLRRANGYNSDIQCVRPEGCKVLALKYPLHGTQQWVYTPYSPELALPEVIAYGLGTLRRLRAEAYDRLRERRVVSASYPDGDPSCAPQCLAADVVPPDISAALMLNEHINPGEFTSADKTEFLVGKALVVLAANEERAWSASHSKAGASGMMQFMPKTYAQIVRAYPAARLEPDYAKGTADPVNALMAQVLLCDRNWHALRKLGYDISADDVGPYLAAAYNGGTTRVLSLLKDPEQMRWMENPTLDAVPTRSVVRVIRKKATRHAKAKRTSVRSVRNIFVPETAKYIIQYDWLDEYLQKKLDP